MVLKKSDFFKKIGFLSTGIKQNHSKFEVVIQIRLYPCLYPILVVRFTIFVQFSSFTVRNGYEIICHFVSGMERSGFPETAKNREIIS